MFHNLLIYTNNFCFGYFAVSCFFETFPAGWLGVVGKSDFNENPVISVDLDFNFGLQISVCQYGASTTPFIQFVADAKYFPHWPVVKSYLDENPAVHSSVLEKDS